MTTLGVLTSGVTPSGVTSSGVMTLALTVPHFVLVLGVALFCAVSILLILTVLIQKPQGGGLAGAFGSGAGSGQTAFGAKTGDALTIATIVMFVVFLIGAILLNFATREAVAGGQPPVLTNPAGPGAGGPAPVQTPPEGGQPAGGAPAGTPTNEPANEPAGATAQEPSGTPEAPPADPSGEPSDPPGEPPAGGG